MWASGGETGRRHPVNFPGRIGRTRRRPCRIPRGNGGQAVSDGAAADHRQTASGQFHPHPRRPCVRPHRPIDGREMACGREHQTGRVFRHRLVQHMRRIGAQQPSVRCLLQIQAVISHAEAGDDASCVHGFIQRPQIAFRAQDDPAARVSFTCAASSFSPHGAGMHAQSHWFMNTSPAFRYSGSVTNMSGRRSFMDVPGSCGYSVRWWNRRSAGSSLNAPPRGFQVMWKRSSPHASKYSMRRGCSPACSATSPSA
jgi:hypothetical protein